MPAYIKQDRADRGAGAPDPVVRDTVARVIDDIRSRGDAAVREWLGQRRRASRVELFEGHARSGDARVAKYGGGSLHWAPGGSMEAGSTSVTGAH